MSEPTHAAVNPKKILTILREYRWLWLGPTITLTMLATGYALIQPSKWEATQKIVVRDEAIGNWRRAGEFDSTEARKLAQESIIEMARNRTVVAAALMEAGPPKSGQRNYPSSDDVRSLRSKISVSPPGGAELGETEGLDLTVTASTPERAIALTGTVVRQLAEGLSRVRDNKAQSLIQELDKTVMLAQGELDEATARQSEIEREAGRDLSDLRSLVIGGESRLKASVNEIERELRQARSKHENLLQQLKTIMDAERDPESLVAASSSLFDSQPALRRLKEGLVDAQLRTAQLQGRMNSNHPLVQGAIRAENEVRQQIRAELAIAQRGIGSDIELIAQQTATLQGKLDDVRTRLDFLAGVRARYSNLVADRKSRAGVLEQAQRAYSEAQASRSAALSTSLITLIDEPHVGDYPAGPGRMTIVLGGLIAGLATGLGLVTLVAPVGGGEGRRWSEMPIFGRRSSDRTGTGTANVAGVGTRSSDFQANPGPAVPGGRRASDPPTDYGRRASDQLGQERRATDPLPHERRRSDQSADSSAEIVDRRGQRVRAADASPPPARLAPPEETVAPEPRDQSSNCRPTGRRDVDITLLPDEHTLSIQEDDIQEDDIQEDDIQEDDEGVSEPSDPSSVDERLGRSSRGHGS